MQRYDTYIHIYIHGRGKGVQASMHALLLGAWPSGGQLAPPPTAFEELLPFALRTGSWLAHVVKQDGSQEQQTTTKRPP